MNKNLRAQAVEKLEELGYDKFEIDTLMAGGQGYYGLCGGLEPEKIMSMAADELRRLCETLLTLQYD